MTSPCKASAGIWSTLVLLSVLVLYPVSFGPACCFAEARSGNAKDRGEITVFNNPLGMPEPDLGKSPGTLVLHGGGEIGDAGEEGSIFHEFIKRAGGNNARIVLIPSGSFVQGWETPNGSRLVRGGKETDDQFRARLAEKYAKWAALQADGHVASFEFLFTDTDATAPDAAANDPRFVEALKNATGVWIQAQYQGKLRYRFAAQDADGHTTLFQRELQNVLHRGGVVGGSGGGLNALSEIMILVDAERNNLGEDGTIEPDLDWGLGVIDGAFLDEHFDEYGGRAERLTNLLLKRKILDQARHRSDTRFPELKRSFGNMIAIGVAANTALFVSMDSGQVFGDGFAHIFSKSDHNVASDRDNALWSEKTIRWRRISKRDKSVAIRERGTPPQPEAELPNPFGLPVDASGDVRGTVIAHGGGSGVSGVLSSLPEIVHKDPCNVYVCPIANAEWNATIDKSGPGDAQLLANLANRYFEFRGQNLHFILATKLHKELVQSSANDLAHADIVWFGGGDQRLLMHLTGTEFTAATADVVRRGGLVGGSSAGTAVLGHIMIAGNESPPMRNAYEYGRYVAQATLGLGVLENVITDQHFEGRHHDKRGRLERLTQVLRDDNLLHTLRNTEPWKMTGVAVEESAYATFDKSGIKASGEGYVHVFVRNISRDSLTWYILDGGTDESAAIVSTADGLAIRRNE